MVVVVAGGAGLTSTIYCSQLFLQYNSMLKEELKAETASVGFFYWLMMLATNYHQGLLTIT